MEPGTTEFKIITSAGMMILIILSLFGNLLVCVAVYQSRSLRTRVNYLIISLAIADIMVASIAMPIWLYTEITGFKYLSSKATHNLVTFWRFMDMLGGISSIANLTVISYERLWSVCSPLNHRRYLTNFTSGIMITSAWVYALIISLTALFWFEKDWCVIYTSVSGFFFPLLLIVMAYSYIFYLVNHRSRNVISAKENTRINLAICIIVGIFVLCWAPYFATSITLKYNHDFLVWVVDHLWYRSFIKWLHYANSFVNPIVYGLANAQYKDAFKQVFKRLFSGCCISFPKKNNTPQCQNKQTTPPFYSNMPSLSPLFSRTKDTKDELRVELSPDDKSKNIDSNEQIYSEYDENEYLPGDYRAIPVMKGKNVTRQNESRWGTNVSDTTNTTDSFVCSGSSPIDDANLFEDTEALREALLNPNSLSRTSYI